MARRNRKATAGPVPPPRFGQFQLGQLNPSCYNPRTISDEALEGLAHSLSKFGCVEPIVVNVRDGRNVIVGGHQRHRALLRLRGAEFECTCVVVDLSDHDERLLNLSLNNPHTQGEFITMLGDHIEQLRSGLDSSDDFVSLRLDELRGSILEVSGSAGGRLMYSERELRPFKKCHVLLSFPPELLAEVEAAILDLIENPLVECEQGAN